jgi:hypothetical protein
MRIGAMTARAGGEPNVNLVASGKTSGVTVVGEISLQIYGEELMENTYYYTCEPTSVAVDKDTYNVSITFTMKTLDQASYDIDY